MFIRLPKSIRAIRRVQTIALVLTQHGFGHLVDRLSLRKYVPFGTARAEFAAREGISSSSATGQRLVRVFNELGPTFIKFGQLLSTRPDLLPAPLIIELRNLQDSVDPFPTSQAMQIVEEDLGDSVGGLFESMADRPLASGSIAQAYRARGKNGAELIVKVRRPDIEEVVDLDMHILRWLAHQMERHIPELRGYRPTGIVDEFEQSMRRELDFINEASTLARFAEVFRGDKTISVPGVHWDLTGPRVLTMDALPGQKLHEILRQEDGLFDCKQIAVNLTQAFMKQFFDSGFFHGDPHPGNLLVTPPANIGLLDFGIFGYIDSEMMGHISWILYATVNQEPDVVVDILADMDSLGPATDRRQLSRELRTLIQKYNGLPLRYFQLQQVFTELTEIIRRNDLTLSRELVLLIKTLVTVAGVALSLDPDFDMWAQLRPRIRRLMIDRLRPDHFFRSAGVSAWHMASILRRTPRLLHDTLRQISRGKWQLNVQHRNLEHLANEMDRSSNRLAFSIVIASTVVGSALVSGIREDVRIFDIPLRFFGILGFLFAGVMGTWLLWAIFRSGRMS